MVQQSTNHSLDQNYYFFNFPGLLLECLAKLYDWWNNVFRTFFLIIKSPFIEDIGNNSITTYALIFFSDFTYVNPNHYI